MSLTYPSALILQAVHNGYGYGFDVMDATGLPSGTVYPALRRLEREGLVRSRWEDPETARREGRPARRYYEIEGRGEKALDEARRRYGLLRQALMLLPTKLAPRDA